MRFSGVVQDLRYAARVLLREPRLSLLAITTVALGIGVTTMFFSVAYALLLKPLPWPAADRLVALQETRGGRVPRFLSFTNAVYLAWRDEMSTVDDVAAWSQRTSTLADGGQAERIRVTAASASLFHVLGVRPLIGALFDEADEQARGGGAIVLSEGLWRRRYAADASVLGRLVSVDGEPSRVVAVLPDEMMFPDRRAQAIVPFHVAPATGNVLSLFDAVARLRPDATPAQAAAEGTMRARFAPDTGLTTTAIFSAAGPIAVAVAPLREVITADVRRPVVMLFIAVGLLLAAATTNVAALQLARATTRHREMAIRAALGAGATRLARQLLAETLLLGLCGGSCGLALAWLLHRSLPSVLPADFPRLGDVQLDAIVALFGLGSSLVAGAIVGLLPAIQGRRLNLVQALAADGANSIPGARGARARARIAIVAGQIAIACVLLAGASMLGRTLLALLTVDRGYQPEGVLTARLTLPASIYTAERRSGILSDLLERLRRVPAVTEAAFTSEFPLVPTGSTSAFTLPAAPGSAVVQIQASPRIVSPRYFQSLGIRIVAGRGFSDADTDVAEPAVIVNRAFARRYLRDNPLGLKLPMAVGYEYAAAGPVNRRDNRRDATLIGIVDDVRTLQASMPPQPEIYYSSLQLQRRLPVSTVTLLMRTAADPVALAGTLRSAVHDADPALVPEAVTTMEDRMWTGLVRPRLYATLSGSLAACALLIAAVGLFGALSQIVAERSRELALRAALGASRAVLVTLVIRQALVATSIGLVTGLSGAAATMRLLESQLFGVDVVDPFTLSAVSGLVFLFAVLACLVPALRAGRLHPSQLLRG